MSGPDTQICEWCDQDLSRRRFVLVKSDDGFMSRDTVCRRCRKAKALCEGCFEVLPNASFRGSAESGKCRTCAPKPKPQKKQKPRTHCDLCGTPCDGMRCKPCYNRLAKKDAHRLPSPYGVCQTAQRWLVGPELSRLGLRYLERLG